MDSRFPCRCLDLLWSVLIGLFFSSIHKSCHWWEFEHFWYNGELYVVFTKGWGWQSLSFRPSHHWTTWFLLMSHHIWMCSVSICILEMSLERGLCSEQCYWYLSCGRDVNDLLSDLTELLCRFLVSDARPNFIQLDWLLFQIYSLLNSALSGRMAQLFMPLSYHPFARAFPFLEILYLILNDFILLLKSLI